MKTMDSASPETYTNCLIIFVNGRYDERTSKNHHTSLKKCHEEDFRLPMIFYFVDVCETWNAYFDHLDDDKKDGSSL
jgi:hypothetical protein